MRPILRSACLVFSLLAAIANCHGACAEAFAIPFKINESAARRLAAQGYYGSTSGLEYFDYDSGVSTKFAPPFIVFDGLSKPPAEGFFGVFAVNPWTGDVWNLWGCHRLSTPALRKSQAAIRQRFARGEIKEYARLRLLKSECVVED